MGKFQSKTFRKTEFQMLYVILKEMREQKTKDHNGEFSPSKPKQRLKKRSKSKTRGDPETRKPRTSIIRRKSQQFSIRRTTKEK